MTNNIQLNGVEVSVEDALAALREKGTVAFVEKPKELVKVFRGSYNIQIEARCNEGGYPCVKELAGISFRDENGRTTDYAIEYISVLKQAVEWAEGKKS